MHVFVINKNMNISGDSCWYISLCMGFHKIIFDSIVTINGLRLHVFMLVSLFGHKQIEVKSTNQSINQDYEEMVKKQKLWGLG